MVNPNIYNYLIRIPHTNKILIVPHRGGSSAMLSALESNWVKDRIQFLDISSLPDGWYSTFGDIFNFILFLSFVKKAEFTKYEFFVPVRHPQGHFKSITELNREKFKKLKEHYLYPNAIEKATEEQLSELSIIFSLGTYEGINSSKGLWSSYFFTYDHGCPSFIRASLLAASGLNVTPLSMDNNEYSNFVNDNILRREHFIDESHGYTIAKRASDHGEVFERLQGLQNSRLDEYLYHLNKIYNIFNQGINQENAFNIIEEIFESFTRNRWHSELIPYLSECISIGMFHPFNLSDNSLEHLGTNELSKYNATAQKFSMARNFEMVWTEPYV